MEGQCECVSEIALPPRANPWGLAPGVAPQPCSLAAVMDEELARELQSKEGGVTAVVEAFGGVLDVFPREEAHATPDDDLLLAQMLQLEFDRESDLHLAAQERHVNGDSKGEWVLCPVYQKQSSVVRGVCCKSVCLCVRTAHRLTSLLISVTISYSRYRSVHPVIAQEENPNPYDLIDDVMEGVSQFYVVL